MAAYLWAVTWRDHRGSIRIVDFSERAEAVAFTIDLTELGERDKVRVDRVALPEDTLDPARKEAIRERVMRVVRASVVSHALREAAGR